jgi:hypothetical protein
MLRAEGECACVAQMALAKIKALDLRNRKGHVLLPQLHSGSETQEALKTEIIPVGRL